ncbi:MAG: tripartite tricarboxylate transporter substrate binding protein, partial [Lentisphaeraceae bacterium]|nr:tripartite tricarboxylate transporter substrate binding protein [Lentisphaeraceae bacterium]
MASKNRGSTYPLKPINVVIPYAAGGGTDTFVRFINKAIRDGNMMSQPMVVVNKPGGSTTIGSSFVKYAKPDGYTVLCLHEALMTTKATGQSPHGPEAFEPIAATGEEGQMILVREDSPYKSLKDLVKAAEAKPYTIKFGADINSPPHFSGIMLENVSNGAKFRIVTSGGASKTLSALLGGHIDTAIFMGSEYIRYKSMGLRALAYLGDERHPSKEINPVPTGTEQGYPVVNNNLQYWWFPKGTDPAKIEYFKKVLKKAMATEYVKG